MKKKIWLWGFLGAFTLIVVSVGWFLNKPVSKFKALNLIPQDAIYLVETTEPIENWQMLRNSQLWTHLRTNKLFAELTESANFLDTLVQENQTIFEMLGSRQLLASAHMYSPKNYDFLFVVDLDKASQMGSLESLLKSFAGDIYNITSRSYKGFTILELQDRETRETLFLSVVENLLVGSYVHLLLEKSLDQVELPELGRNLAFQQVNQEVEGKEMLRVYLNYQQLDDYLNLYLEEPVPTLTDASNWLEFSGLKVKMDKQSNLYAEGVTNLNDSVSSYLKAMLKSGKGRITIPEVAPKRTAFMMHLGFDSFLELYENFEKTAENELPDYQEYQKNLRKLEKFLDINLKENIFGWIDDELAIVQALSTKKGEPFELAIILKAKSAKEASKQLDFLGDQIRKKTPVRFKGITYKDYTIKFLSVKGLFKVLLGKLFAGLEKPYYTVIDDYVIFSNHPQTLKGLIDDYEAKLTLSKDDGFKAVQKDLSKSSNVLLYSHTPLLLNSAMAALTDETRKELQTNQPYIICFSNLALQLEKKGEVFSTILKVDYAEPENSIARVDQIMNERKLQGNSEVLMGPAMLQEMQLPDFYDELVDVEAISPDDLDAEEYVEKYENGQVKFEVSLKDGVKHGSYREYYETGELKVKGKFKNDQKDGTWRIYKPNGKLMEKQRYRNGNLQ